MQEVMSLPGVGFVDMHQSLSLDKLMSMAISNKEADTLDKQFQVDTRGFESEVQRLGRMVLAERRMEAAHTLLRQGGCMGGCR